MTRGAGAQYGYQYHTFLIKYDSSYIQGLTQSRKVSLKGEEHTSSTLIQHYLY